MDDQQLADILAAYLGHIGPQTLRRIYDTQAASWQAAMQLGTSAQAEATAAEREAIALAVANLGREGRRQVQQAISRAVPS